MAKTKLSKIELTDGVDILTGFPMNELMQINKYTIKNNDDIDDIILFDNPNFTILSTDTGLKELHQDAKRLLGLISNGLTRNNSNCIHIHLREYAYICGYDDVYSNDKKIAQAALSNFRKVYNRAIHELSSIQIKTKRQNTIPSRPDIKDITPFDRVSLIKSGYLGGGVYYIKVDDDITAALREQGYITQVPCEILRIGRNINAGIWTELLYELSNHYNINNNKLNGSNNILSIACLLKWTTLPTVEQLKKTNNRKYYDRILQPLFNQLDYYVNAGILTDWYIAKARKKPISDEEMYAMSPQTIINECFLVYEMATKK